MGEEIGKAKRRVLVADDQDFIRSLVSESLWDAGYEVVEAESGDKAALLIEALDHIDLILTDIQMPGFLDGVALAALVRKTHPNLPVIYMTGRPDRFQAILQSHDALVVKPFAIRDLIAAVAKSLTSASLN